MMIHESLPTIKPIALDLLKKLFKNHKDTLKVADFGSGSEPQILLGLSDSIQLKYYAVDIDRKRLDKLKARIPNNISRSLKIVCADVQDLPLKSNTIDLILFFETIEHLKNPDRALKEIVRIAKPNAIVLISTPNIHRPDILIKRLFFLLVGIKKKYPEDYFYSSEHVKEWGKNLKKIIEVSGLIIKEWKSIPYPFEYVGFRSLVTLMVYPLLNFLIFGLSLDSLSPILFAICKVKEQNPN